MIKEQLFHNTTCTELMTMAQQELAAFIGAVTELYGAEQAQLSAEDWLHELVSMDGLPGPTARDWQIFTIAVLARLANRLHASSHPSALVTHADSNRHSEKSKDDQQVWSTNTIEAAKGEEPWQL